MKYLYTLIVLSLVLTGCKPVVPLNTPYSVYEDGMFFDFPEGTTHNNQTSNRVFDINGVNYLTSGFAFGRNYGGALGYEDFTLSEIYKYSIRRDGNKILGIEFTSISDYAQNFTVTKRSSIEAEVKIFSDAEVELWKSIVLTARKDN